MTLPRTAGEVLGDHVTFEVERIDRMYLNVILIPDAWQVADLGSRVGDGVLDAVVASW
jgi:hypothetical protein